MQQQTQPSVESKGYLDSDGSRLRNKTLEAPMFVELVRLQECFDECYHISKDPIEESKNAYDEFCHLKCDLDCDNDRLEDQY